MIFSDKDKKLVDQYKQTNLALRKQLHNLNSQIDKILKKRSNKVGLTKLPVTQKKITDPKVVHQQVENLKKRLEVLQKDLHKLKNKTKNNYPALIKQAEGALQEQQQQIYNLKKQLRQHERQDKRADVIAMKSSQNTKWEKKIANMQEQLARFQKIQKDLVKELNEQAVIQTKSINYIHQLASRHHETVVKMQHQKSKSKQKKSPQKKLPPLSPKKQPNGPSQQDWIKLKTQFLTLKESKQSQEFNLEQENQRLRKQIKDWQRKIREKKNRIEIIKSNEQKEALRMKNYSTLEHERKNKDQNSNFRYRDRYSSIQYNTKQ